MRLTEPIDDAGQPMITVRQAAQTIGRERPWITRQLHAGARRGRKIGNDPRLGPWTTGTPAPPLILQFATSFRKESRSRWGTPTRPSRHHSGHTSTSTGAHNLSPQPKCGIRSN